MSHPEKKEYLPRVYSVHSLLPTCAKEMSRPPLSRAALRCVARDGITTPHRDAILVLAGKQAASGSHNLALPDAVLPSPVPRCRVTAWWRRRAIWVPSSTGPVRPSAAATGIIPSSIIDTGIRALSHSFP